MKLRVRIQRQTSKLEILGQEPTLKELISRIRETLLPSHRLSADTEFSLSLNGTELLTDTGQTLSSCGIVSGDLICVTLPESAAASATNTATDKNEASMPSCSTEVQRTEPGPQTAAMATNQPSSGSAGPSEPEETQDMEDAGPSSSSWEPMLCGEAEGGQAPLSLELLYHSAQTASPSEAVVVVVNLLMIETGFVPEGCELKPAEMPAGWRSAGGVYKLQYSHPLCGDSQAMVVAVSMGATLVINAVLKANQTTDTVCKLCVNPSTYVSDAWPGESAAAAFRDLNKLSRVFKDQVAYPLIAAAREAMALPVAFGLAALPPELVLRVLRLLDVTSVVRLSSVCRHFRVATADSSLWRHLYRRDFTDSDSSRPRDTDWRELYKQHHTFRSKRPRYHGIPAPPFPRHPQGIFNPPPFYPGVPGIIGGDYDQRLTFPHGLLPRPRYDPIGPLHDPHWRPPFDRRVQQPGRRPADMRRGFI